MRKYLTEDDKWVRFYPKINYGVYVEKAGYFDERPNIVTSITQLITLFLIGFLIIYSYWFILLTPFIFFGWGKLYINLPIKTGIQDCDSAAWGVNFHNNMIWIYIGGAGNFDGGRKWVTIRMPWDMDWVRTSTLLYDNTWFHETKRNRKKWNDGDNIGSYDWLEKNKWIETHPYTDKYDGTELFATISVEEREWRPYWFKWLTIFSKTQKTISIDFDREVGERKGSWKGGTLGCGYELLPNETPLECLRRMEKDRNF